MSGPRPPVEELLSTRSIVVCCGSGGVGKTTTAAALGLAAAEMGRRACVVTIDPAKRLADALGASGVANEPIEIVGAWPGSLSAVMLDAKGTFDDLVRRYATDEAQVARILANPLYRNLVTALSGTQEYMATEKLFELSESAAYDVVIVDTPPSRHALDFLDAPGRLTGFLDNRIFRLLLTPGRSYLRAMSVATQLLLKTIGKIAGGEIVEDTIAFFQAFDGMEKGFRARAARVDALLKESSTAFVLIVAPRRDSIDEAAYFAEKVTSGGHKVDALVVNRVHPILGAAPALRHDDSAEAVAWTSLVTNLAELEAVAEREASFLAGLVEKVDPAPVVRVPFLEDDVHDLLGLDVVVRHLVSEPLRFGRGEDPPRQ